MRPHWDMNPETGEAMNDMRINFLISCKLTKAASLFEDSLSAVHAIQV